MGFNADIADRLIGGRYALEFLIGRGGVGEVWRARHIDLGTNVAIKFLLSGLASRESTRRRFLTEAQLAARLRSKHAVHVFDFGITDKGQPYLVMELLDGETLAARIKREQRLDPSVTVRLLAQCARALSRAHSLGIVHRDFKPENILIGVEDGQESVKILDFGVASLVGDLDNQDPRPEDVEPASGEAPRSGSASFSRTSAVLGTPLYMAPEQTEAHRPITPAADVWAFGVVAYVCLTGIMPFDGSNVTELFDAIRGGRYASPRLAGPHLPEAFDRWFARCCDVDAARRFPSAREAVLELAEALGLSERSNEELRSQLVQDHSVSIPALSTSGTVPQGTVGAPESLTTATSPEIPAPDLLLLPDPHENGRPVVARPPPPPDRMESSLRVPAPRQVSSPGLEAAVSPEMPVVAPRRRSRWTVSHVATAFVLGGAAALLVEHLVAVFVR